MIDEKRLAELRKEWQDSTSLHWWNHENVEDILNTLDAFWKVLRAVQHMRDGGRVERLIEREKKLMRALSVFELAMASGVESSSD